MKCEICGNDYPSQYYFATPTICKTCFAKLPPEEQSRLSAVANQFITETENELRIPFGRRLGAYLLDMIIIWILTFIAMWSTGIIAEVREQFVNMLTNREIMMSFTERVAPLTLIISILYYSFEIFLAATIKRR